jgi:hypothetical protein
MVIDQNESLQWRSKAWRLLLVLSFGEKDAIELLRIKKKNSMILIKEILEE